MQVGGPVEGAGTIHPHGQPNALLALAAIVMIAAVVVLMVWAVPLVTSGAGAADTIPKPEASWVTLYDAEGNPHLVHLRAGGAEDAAPWVRLYDEVGNPHLITAR
jgi:hypothetical protein